MSTTMQIIGILALILGAVALVFGLVYLWEYKLKGTALEKKIDDFADRISDRFFDR